MTNRKDAAGLKPATGPEVAGGSELGPSGQRRPSRQAAVRPMIIEVEESAKEMDRGEEQGKLFSVSPKRNITEPHRSDPETEGHRGGPGCDQEGAGHPWPH